jgi:hypothetical protein
MCDTTFVVDLYLKLLLFTFQYHFPIRSLQIDTVEQFELFFMGYQYGTPGNILIDLLCRVIYFPYSHR